MKINTQYVFKLLQKDVSRDEMFSMDDFEVEKKIQYIFAKKKGAYDTNAI